MAYNILIAIYRSNRGGPTLKPKMAFNHLDPHLFKFVFLFDKNCYNPDDEIPQQLSKKGAHFEFIDWGSLQKGSFLKGLRVFFQAIRILKKNKINLAHFVFPRWHDPVILATKLLKIKSIFHIVGPTYPDNPVPSWIGYCNYFIANSNFTKTYHEDYPFYKNLGKKFIVIHNAIEKNDIDSYKADPEKLRKELAIKKNEIIVAYVGRFSPVKGIEYFVKSIPDVLKSSPQTRFLMMGNPENKDYYNKIKRIIDDFKLTNKIIDLGYREDVLRFFNIIDIMVIPSLEEPFGIVNLEAGAFGIPVIASDVEGIPEVIIHNKTGILVPPANEKEIAVSVIKLIEQPDIRKKMEKAARKRVLSHFEAKEYAEKLQDFYLKILSVK